MPQSQPSKTKKQQRPRTGAAMQITSKEITEAGDLALSVRVHYEELQFDLPILIQKDNIHMFSEQALKERVIKEGAERYRKHYQAKDALGWIDDNINKVLELDK